MADHELTLEATGHVRINTTTAADDMTVTESESREVTAEIALDADRLYDSDIATTRRSGVTIDTRDVADAVAERIDATPLSARDWELTVTGALDDWQKVAMQAAKERRKFESDRVDTALDVLLTLHERHAETDRPLLAALNIDETYEHGRREEIISELDSIGHILQATNGETPSLAPTEEVVGDV